MKSISLFKEQTGLIKDISILDTGSTITATFKNEAFLTDILQSENPMKMLMNAGTKVLKQKEHLCSFGEVWYNEIQAANLLSCAHLRDRFKTEFNYINDTFTVHFKAGLMVFEHCDEVLYLFIPSDSFFEWVASTKEGNDAEASKPRSDDAKPTSVWESKRVNLTEEIDTHYFNWCASKREFPTKVEEVSKEDTSTEVGVQQMVTTVDENHCEFTSRQFEKN